MAGNLESPTNAASSRQTALISPVLTQAPNLYQQPEMKHPPVPPVHIPSSDEQNPPFAQASFAHARSFQQVPHLYPSHPTQPPPLASTVPNDVVEKIQRLPGNLQVFLDHNFESKAESVKNIQYYMMIYHFNSKTKARPTHNKTKLKQLFNEEVKALILPFRKSPPQVCEPMQTEDAKPADDDFNPLHRKTSKLMLSKAITKRVSDFVIAPTARIEQLLWLYKAKVDPDLALPKKT